MSDEGYIKLYRKARENFLYRENRPHTRREAWEDILLMVNHADKEVLIGNEKFLVKRGQSVRSLDSWAKEFNWSKSKTKRFFDLLKSCSMIVTENVQKSTRLTVCNYDIYQGDRNVNETQMKRDRPTNKNEKNEKNIKVQKTDFSHDVEQMFESFWKQYDKERNKAKCLKKYSKLSKADRDAIKKHLPKYLESTPDKQYRKDPLNYLNNRSWEDEIILPKEEMELQEELEKYKNVRPANPQP